MYILLTMVFSLSCSCTHRKYPPNKKVHSQNYAPKNIALTAMKNL